MQISTSIITLLTHSNLRHDVQKTKHDLYHEGVVLFQVYYITHTFLVANQIMLLSAIFEKIPSSLT